ncbi:uncharacterized protein [Brachionichthys hirsutus]|uniref:uncharacterized protein n=1 Tax=Brachionichthys hirsutus TaxID=412623 RepID=UPI003604D02D
MAHSHAEIRDSSSNHNSLAPGCDCDPKSTSDSDSMADTLELRLITAYAKRRRMKEDGPIAPSADASSTGRKLLSVKPGAKDPCRFFSRAKPRAKKAAPPPRPATFSVQSRCLASNDDSSDSFREDDDDDELEDVASKLTEIADEIPFTPPEMQSDSKDECSPGSVDKVIALLLRGAGDKLNKEELAKAGIAKELFWNYSFFEAVLSTLLLRMGLGTSEANAPGPQASTQTQIAVACEVTSRLSALDTLPMSRMLDHGARFLQVHYSSWAQRRGGYEQAFSRDDDDDDEDEVQ